jgi:hypothetical protein
VNRNAQVVEEVAVARAATERRENIGGTVRQTVVDVQREANPEADEAAYRVHHADNFAHRGEYERYAPAYRYGSELAGEPRHHGRTWDQLEHEARADWQARHPDLAWEDNRSAVRYGWERMMGPD